MSSVEMISAIDVHGHYGAYKFPGVSNLQKRFMSGTPQEVVAAASRANTEWTIVSPLLGLLPRGDADAVAGNEEAYRVVHETDGLLQWVVVNPLQPETYSQATRMLEDPKCAGIKIHPEEHRYPIREYGNQLFEFAAGLSAVILSHSGEANSLPRDLVRVSDTFPEVVLILAHLGNSGPAGSSFDLQVRAIADSRQGNAYVDTSSSKSIISGLIEWAVGEIGAERIMYGTDTPLHFAPSQRARIDASDITDDEKQKILRGNAETAFPFFRQRD